MEIAILGAGVAGLSTAIALSAFGHTVSVYERQQVPVHIGAGIVLWPNAAFVLDQLGLLDDVAAQSGRIKEMRRMSEKAVVLGSLDIARLNQRMGYPSYSILRKDLMAILRRRALSDGVSIFDGYVVKSLAESKTLQAKAYVENGFVVDADLIIGADGRMNSAARSYVYGNNKPVYQGFSNWVGVFETTQPMFDDRVVRDYWGVGARFGVVPISPQQAYWAGALAEPTMGDIAPASYKSELLSLFKDWPEPITAIINGSRLSEINKIYVHDHEPIDVWYRDNVLLIGDAAHAALPTSGQGACQAMEDAWHLAQLLKAGRNNLSKTLEDFTQLRTAKTRGITMGARQFAISLFNTDPDYCEQRNRRSQSSDYNAAVDSMAIGWGDGLVSTD